MAEELGGGGGFDGGGASGNWETNDSSTPSLSTLTNELNQIPGVNGIDGTVGVNSDVSTALPAAAADSAATARQKLEEISDIINASTGRQVKTNVTANLSNKTAEFKARLVSKANPSDFVTFLVSPVIDEARQANYEHLSPVHHPGTIQVYKNTESRTFNLTGKFVARTPLEASQNLKWMNIIRSWVMPYYGKGTAVSTLKDKLGAPPDILIFDAYGPLNINSLPVVLQNYHWIYPDNVDYIPSTDGVPCPTIIDVTLSLIEAFAPEEFTGFDITKYKSGDMVGAFTFSASPADQ